MAESASISSHDDVSGLQSLQIPEVKLRDFEKEYQARKRTYDEWCKDLKTKLDRLLKDLEKDLHFRAEVVGARVKEARRIRENAERDGIALETALDTMEDIVGARIVCNNLEDIEKVIQTVSKHPEIKVLKVDPPEKASQGTDLGYRGRHLVAMMRTYWKHDGTNQLVEIQVRTLLQHAWAVLSHVDFYKPETEEPTAWLKERMKQLSDRLYELDKSAQVIRGAADKRYADIKRSLSDEVSAKLAEGTIPAALRSVFESLSRTDRATQLAAIEIFVQNPSLWEKGMPDLASEIPKMDEWMKMHLTERLLAVDPEQLVAFKAVLDVLVGG
jgi:putative GTP pyrophosphokinase